MTIYAKDRLIQRSAGKSPITVAVALISYCSDAIYSIVVAIV